MRLYKIDRTKLPIVVIHDHTGTALKQYYGCIAPDSLATTMIEFVESNDAQSASGAAINKLTTAQTSQNLPAASQDTQTLPIAQSSQQTKPPSHE